MRTAQLLAYHLNAHAFFEVLERRANALFQGHLRIEVEELFGFADVGAAALRIVGRERLELDADLLVRDLHDDVRESAHRELTRVADVDRRIELLDARCREEPVDKIVDVTKRTRLLAVTVERDRLALQHLRDEVADDATVVEGHAWAVCVEDAQDAHVRAESTLRVDHHRLGGAFAFVVTRTLADR